MDKQNNKKNSLKSSAGNYCAVCGLQAKQFQRFGEWFCSSEHMDDFVAEIRKEKITVVKELNNSQKSIQQAATSKDPSTQQVTPSKQQATTSKDQIVWDFLAPLNNAVDILVKERYAKAFFLIFVLSLVFFSFLNGFFLIPFLDIGFIRMSEITLFDYLFITLVSILVSTLFALFLYQKDEMAKISDENILESGGSGSIAGFLAAICPSCQAITFAAFGATVFAIPLEPLIPILDLLKFVALALLGLSVYVTSNNIYKKTCVSVPTQKPLSISNEATSLKNDTPSFLENYFLKNNLGFSLLIALALILVVNQLFLTSVLASVIPEPGTAAFVTATGTVTVDAKGNLSYGSKLTLKPMPLSLNEQAVIASYKTKVKSLPTISEISIAPSTGDLLQDLVNNVIPKGTPWYGEAAGGVTFDDPIKSQNLWGKGRAIELSSEEQKRWDKIANSFTCDYCCGSPQNPTIITRCGCAHAKAAQGMAKWFIKNYGDQFSDEEIYGEMGRWYALWYPGPTVKRIAQEIQASA